jgi:hypothetical protein
MEQQAAHEVRLGSPPTMAGLDGLTIINDRRLAARAIEIVIGTL